MKRSVFLALTALLWCSLCSGAFAAGDYVPGYVRIGPDNRYLHGTFNVRFNAAPSTAQAYLGAGGYANGIIYFYGQDGDGRSFYCYVPTSSAIYTAAVQIKNTLGNGSMLMVERQPPSSECTSLYAAKASHYLY